MRSRTGIKVPSTIRSRSMLAPACRGSRLARILCPPASLPRVHPHVARPDALEAPLMDPLPPLVAVKWLGVVVWSVRRRNL